MPAGIVLTGGTAQLEGLEEYAERRLGMPARIGAPNHVSGLVEAVRSPAHSTGVGLVVHGATARTQVGTVHRNGTSSAWERAREWVREILQGG